MLQILIMGKVNVIKQTIFHDKVHFIRFEIMGYFKDVLSLINQEGEFLMTHLQPYVDEKRKFMVRVLCYLEGEEGQSKLCQVQSGPGEFVGDFLATHAMILDTRLAEHDIMYPNRMILELSFDCIRTS